MNSLPLGQVASFIRGITFQPGDVIDAASTGAVACMRTSNVQESLALHDVWGIPARFVKRPEQYLREGDVLVSSANSWNLLGKCCWVPKLSQEATLGGFISAIRVNPEALDARYFYHWFSSSHTQVDVRNCGRQTTNISNLDLERVLRLKVPLPGLKEQGRIAAILDQAEALRAKRSQALVKLDTLTQSLFSDMFGDPTQPTPRWTYATLGESVQMLQYGPRFHNESYVESGVRIARITDLDSSGDLDYSQMPKLGVSESDRQNFTLQRGDIIFARTGATVGKVTCIRDLAPECIAGAYFIRLRFHPDRILPDYAYAALASQPVQEIISKQSRQAAQQNFSGPGLRRLPLPLAPLQVQRQFSQRVAQIEVERKKLKMSAVSFDRISDSLQYRAFRGEL